MHTSGSAIGRKALTAVASTALILGSMLFSAVASANSFAGLSWQNSGNGSTSVTQDTGDCVTFNYDASYPNYSMEVRSWNFQTRAAQSGPINFSYDYSGIHSWFMAQVGMTAWADGPSGRTSIPQVPWQYFSGGFDFQGVAALSVTAGYDYGFTMQGTNFDSSWLLRGNMKVCGAGDTTPPTITPTVSGTLGNNGWYTSPVTVSFACADPDDSGAGCPSPVTFGQGANQSTTVTAVDSAGNKSTLTVGPYNVDTTAPTITAKVDRPANSNGWYNAPVTVSFTCGDSLSGVATCPAPVTLSGEGANQSVNGTATDQAGNSASVTLSGINIDQTAPTITAKADRPANSNDWYNAPVTVSFTCGDGLSGAATCPAPITLSSDGANQSVNGTATDKAGNSASVTLSGISIDQTAPTITAKADRPANSNGWYNAPVTVSFTCGDGLSGAATCPAPITLSSDGANQSVSGTATDKAGNSASTSLGGINIDLTPPTVAYTGNAGTYTVDQTVNITCTAGDNLSGVASTTCANSNGPAYTFQLGNNTYSASATDKAGNTGTGSTSFTVQATYASLCNLTEQFVSSAGEANSLCVKLDNAGKQAAAGKTTSSNNLLQAYINEVSAQSGKALTAAQAAVLIRLAQALQQ